MPRKNLDQAEGESKKIEIRVPASLREAIEQVLDPGEKLSAFARSAFEAEIAKRKRKK